MREVASPHGPTISLIRGFPMKRLLLLIVVSTFSMGAFAQCAAFPCVVAATSLTNQTQAIPPTTLLTPTTEGTFRINVYLTTGDGTNGGLHWDVFLRWVDGIRARNTDLSALTDQTNVPFGTIVVHNVAGQPLEYRTAVGAGTPHEGASRRYDLFLVVEQLQ
jgi:hypothetical protein